MILKNIAIFIDSLAGGGAERVMLDIAQHLKSQGHQVTFFLLEPVVDYVIEEGIDYQVLYQTGKRTTFTNYFHLKKTAKDMRSLVNGVEQRQGKFNLYLSNLDSTNQVLNRCGFDNTYYVIHNAISQEIKRAKKIQFLRYLRVVREKKILNGKRLIAVSHGIKQEIDNSKFITPISIETIYNPCDIDKIQQLASIENSDIPKQPYLIHIGRVVKQKRHDVLFKALKNIPDINLVLLCKNIKKAQKLAQKYNVEDRIIFAGFQSNPYNWIANAKAMVFSSDFEGLGMVLIESLVCDTPVVSTDCPYGPNEILEGELAQYLVPVGDHQALSLKVTSLLNGVENTNSDEFTKTTEKFSINASVEKYLKLAN